MSDKIRAAIYIRVSTPGQAEEGYSLEAQENILRKYCASRNWEIAHVYADEGISGKTISRRPQMVQLLNDARDQKFNCVLVWKLTRFTRSLSDLCRAFELLDQHGISLVSYSESFDCSVPAGRMMMNILGTVAQWEREVIAENVLLAMESRANKGLRTCSRVLGYDVIKGGGMTVNDAEAAQVKDMFEQYTKLKSMVDLAGYCRAKGYHGKNGGTLQAWHVEQILTRFVYCGYYSWHRTPIKGDFVPIISVELYNRVQRIIANQGKIYGRERKDPLVFL